MGVTTACDLAAEIRRELIQDRCEEQELLQVVRLTVQDLGRQVLGDLAQVAVRRVAVEEPPARIAR